MPRKQRQKRVASHKIQEERIKYLTDEKRIKAVTVLFSDLEGRLHMLDYDKKFLIKSWDNLTFDRLLDSRLHRAARKRLAAGDGIGARFTGRPRTSSGPARFSSSAHVIDKDGSPYAADIAEC